jgi:pimeloyl-ACP methyl ester carboxylesterase
VRAIFPSNIAGGVICDGYLTCKLFKSMEVAAADGIGAVIDAFDADDRFAPFCPEIAQTDSEVRKNLESMDTEEFIQVMRATAQALFGGPFPTLGSTKDMLRSIRVPTMIMPGYNDVHPRAVAEMAHRLVPNSQWGECKPHADEPEKYGKRVQQFLSHVEAGEG